MSKLWRIKWELVFTILLGVLTLFSWSVAETIKDYRVILIAIINLILLIIIIISYNKIKEFRLQVYKMWK